MSKKQETENGFSFSTIQEFDTHILNSIAGYSDLVQDILAMSKYFVEDYTNVYDIGCSTGKLTKELAGIYPNATCIGIEKELNFKEFLENQGLAKFIFQSVFEVELRNASMVTSVFTIQFLPVAERQKLFQRVYDSLRTGGAFILCEKLLANHPKFQSMFTFVYYDFKRNTFSDTSILEKEKSLRSIMKCLTFDDYKNMLESVGFKTVEVFWKRYNFTGILCIK